jgi:hypothetical protein
MLNSGSGSVPVSIIESPEGICECEEPLGTWREHRPRRKYSVMQRDWQMGATNVSPQMTYQRVQCSRQLEWVSPSKEGLNACYRVCVP